MRLRSFCVLVFDARSHGISLQPTNIDSAMVQLREMVPSVGRGGMTSHDCDDAELLVRYLSRSADEYGV